MIILVVDNNAEETNVSISTLKIPWPDAEIVHCTSGRSGLDAAASKEPDLILIDLDLPDMNGFDFLEELYLFSTKPTIALRKSLCESDIVRGLQLGADECLPKPITQLSFIAKSQSVVRRYIGRDDVDTIVVGKLRLEAAVHRAYLDGREIALTRNENIIMHRLMQNCNRVTSYNNIARAVWGNDASEANAALRMCVQRLRKKIHPETTALHIITERGTGFRLVHAR